MKRIFATVLFIFCSFLAINFGSFLNSLIHRKMPSDQLLQEEVIKKISAIYPQQILPSEQVIVIVGRSTSIWAYRGAEMLEDLNYANLLDRRCQAEGKLCRVYNFSSIHLDTFSHVVVILNELQRHFPRIDYIVFENLRFMSYDSLPLLEKLLITPVTLAEGMLEVFGDSFLHPRSQDNAARVCVQKSLALIKNEVRLGRDVGKDAFLNLFSCTHHDQERLAIFETLFDNQMPVKDFESLRTALKELSIDYDDFFTKAGIIPISKAEWHAMRTSLKMIKPLTGQRLVFVSGFRQPLKKEHLKILSDVGVVIDLYTLVHRYDPKPNYSYLLPDAFHYNPWVHEILRDKLFDLFFKKDVTK